MKDFVAPGSIVRRIWGDGDTVLLVFAGSAAEFALNRAVDWLFFTGNLPRDPIGRVFTTARFAQEIVFVNYAAAELTLARIRAIHEAVEAERGQQIPAWAHRSVLYMLIDYSERSYRLLHHSLTEPEQHDLYDVFRRVGTALGIAELPATYADWRMDRRRQLARDLAFSEYTAALYAQYRRHLGSWRYALLQQVQGILLPSEVLHLLRAKPKPWLRLAIPAYRALVRVGLRPLVRRILLPPRYLGEVRRLDQALSAD